MFTSQKYLNFKKKLRQKKIIASYVKKNSLKNHLVHFYMVTLIAYDFPETQKTKILPPTISALKKKWQRKMLKAFKIQNRILKFVAIILREKCISNSEIHGLRLYLNN